MALPELSHEEKISESIKLKEEANIFFKKNQYDKAIQYYTSAIDTYPDPRDENDSPCPAAFFSNRSFAYLKNDCPAAALKDAQECIDKDKNFIKGYYRRASANMLLRNLDKAFKDYELGLVCFN